MESHWMEYLHPTPLSIRGGEGRSELSVFPVGCTGTTIWGVSLANCTAKPYNRGMEFIETSLFTRLIYDCLSEEEYLGLQEYLLRHPESGKIVSGFGGVRKLRWAVRGKGKMVVSE